MCVRGTIDAVPREMEFDDAFFWSIIYLFTILLAQVPKDDMLMCANRDPGPLSLTATLDFDLATVS
jgi:hypothetical protein